MNSFFTILLVSVAVVFANAASDCLTNQKQKQKLKLLGTYIPQCEADGSYSAVQCFTVKCWCVDKIGTTIGSYGFTVGGRFPPMNCQCARDELAAKLKYPFTDLYCASNGDYDTKCHVQQKKYKIVNTYKPKCDKNGTFEALQCSNSRCFCVDKGTGYQIENYQFETTDTNTDCQCARDDALYRKRGACINIHCRPNGSYKTCTEQQSNFNKAPQDPRAYKPDCDKQGDFKAKQCSTNECVCVNEHGNRIASYAATLDKSKAMTCKCAVDQDKYTRTGLIGLLFFCDSFGNYKKT